MPARSLPRWIAFCVSLALFLEEGWAATDLLPPAPQPWYRGCLLGMEVGPTGAQFGSSDTNDARYCARFSGREIVRRCAAAHCEYVVIWARDGDFAYYDSKLLLKAPGLAGRDPLRETVEEARRFKMPVIAYCVVQQGGQYLAAHPEFAMRGADGSVLGGRFCYNSGYLDAMKQIVGEQLAYGIDGFHLDMLDQGFGAPYGCWCGACRRRFESEYGKPMPKGVTWDADWERMMEFRYLTSARFERELCAHIKSLNPRASVDFNYHGNPPFSWEVGQRPVQHATNADFVTGETGVWGFSALTVGLNAEFYRAATPGRPFQVAMQRGVRMYHDQTTRPLADMRWELLTLLAHGAFVTMVDKTAFDGGLDPVAYDRIGHLFVDARARRAHFGHPPVADVGIYFSSRTRDWFGRERPFDAYAGFLGAQKAMVYAHIPWGVVLDETASVEALQAFPVVLLPNVAILSEAETVTLRRYVEAGGKLLVTGLTGCYDRWGNLQKSTPVEGLIGARLVRKLDSLDNWVRFTGKDYYGLEGPNLAHGGDAHQPVLGPDWPFLVKGPAAVYEPTTARPVAQLLAPHRTVRQQQGKEGTDWPMSPDQVVGPAVLAHAVGKGTVLTFAGSPDWAASSEHHIVETRNLLANAVHFLHPGSRVRIGAPASVEAVVSDDANTQTLRVHFLGYSAPPQTMPARERPYVLPSLMEDAPIYRASIECAFPVKRAHAFNRSTEIRRKGSRLDLLIDDVHEVVTISY